MEVWFFLALGSAIFAALTTILAKVGITDVDSHLATAIRTIVVLIFAWLIVFLRGSLDGIGDIQSRTWVVLVLSGLATGGSWLCFFRALKFGDVNKVIPIDKSSTILTMVLAFIFLQESITIIIVIGMVFMAYGTWLMLELKKQEKKVTNNSWLPYALAAAAFASLVAILGRIGVVDMDPNLWTAARTMVVVPISLLMVFVADSQKTIKKIAYKSWIFLILSGIATGTSWLLFYHALRLGSASHVVPIDRLSILFTMSFAFVFLKERFSRRSVVGLIMLTLGALLVVI